MTTQRLADMANQVTSFFSSYPEAAAIESTANHQKSFWDPRMRREIKAHLAEQAGAGLSHIAPDAAKRVAAKDGARKSA